MPEKEIFVLKIVLKKSIASLHRLTQAVQHANLKRTAGDPTWVISENLAANLEKICMTNSSKFVIYLSLLLSLKDLLM